MQSLAVNYFLPVIAAFLFITLWVGQQLAGAVENWLAFQGRNYPETLLVTQTLASDQYLWVWLPPLLAGFPYEIAQLFLVLVGLLALSRRLMQEILG
jgi:hypothetical protein